ncbi:hypothetical protein OIO90_002568 [Microbotryomycetes sp. JL221]|nr:hypothetical protein OIO90_002568 [Microbotryomycetes sp. JL221]
MTYPNPSNTSLLQCSHCPELADVLQTLTFEHVLVDLLLLKPRVYRHLLVNRRTTHFNRSTNTSQQDRSLESSSANDNIKDQQDHHASELSTNVDWSTNVGFVGMIVLGLDAYPVNTISQAYVSALGTTFYETASLYSCIMLVAYLSRFIPSRSGTNRPLCSLKLLPLTLFYSSIPTLFMLTVSNLIYPKEYRSASADSLRAADLVNKDSVLVEFLSFVCQTLETLSNKLKLPGLSNCLNRFVTMSSTLSSSSDWANEFLLRYGVGGLSAIVGVSVLLNAPTLRTTMVLGLACCLKSLVDLWLM